MVANMKVGTMDCFCVGEPWNEQLKNQKIGYTAINTGELWNKHPEKSFAHARRLGGQTSEGRAWRCCMAVQEAADVVRQDENRQEVAEIVAKRAWFNAPVDGHRQDRLQGQVRLRHGQGGREQSPHIMKFWRDNASYPYQSHELWFLTENVRWGKFTGKEDFKALISKVNREDLWRAAAKELKVPAAQIPATTSRGVEKFFDGKVFDPANPGAYLASLAIKRSA